MAKQLLSMFFTPFGPNYAPAGGFSPLREVLRTALHAPGDIRQAVEAALSALFAYQPVRVFGSGKESLAAVLSLLKRRYGVYDLALSAFGCPDVISAAVCAGFRVSLVDVEVNTLQMKADTAPIDRGVVLLSNLFGLIDRADPWQSAFLCVDDGCQGALSMTRTGRVGGRREMFGVVSFGRGKAVCGVGGGAVIFPQSAEFGSNGADAASECELFEEWGGRSDWSGDGGGESSLAALLRWGVSALFEHPRLYGIPLSLPFLHLGEVRFVREVARRAPSRFSLLVALSQLNALEDRAAVARRNGALWSEALSHPDLIHPLTERGDTGSVPLRYPVLVPNHRIREQLVQRLRPHGVSASYGTTLPHLVGEGCYKRVGAVAGAEEVAARLVTLPTHRYVSPSLVEWVSREFTRAVKGGTAPLRRDPPSL